YDVGFGGYFTLPGGVHYEGGYGEGDRFWYLGAETPDYFAIVGDEFRSGNFAIKLVDISYIGVQARGGDDRITVSGDQQGRRLDLQGGAGNDIYYPAPLHSEINVMESA